MGKTAKKKEAKSEGTKKTRKRVPYVELIRFLIASNFDVDASWIADKELPDPTRGESENAGIKATPVVWKKLASLLLINEEHLPKLHELQARYSAGGRGPRVDAGQLLSGSVIKHYKVLTNPQNGQSFIRVPYVREWYGSDQEDIKVKVQWLEREIVITRTE